MGPLLTTMGDMVDTTTVDTTAMDTDTVTDTDIMVKLLLKLQLLSHISSPIIELSINQKTTAPPPYIHPTKKRKIFGSTEEISFFLKTSGLCCSNYGIQLSICDII